MKTLEDLVAIIKANPGCCAVIDNDAWYIYKSSPYAPPEGADDEWEPERLTDSGEFGRDVSHVYGQGILDALAAIVGITVEGV